jgi:hypothetical protein
LGRTLEHRRFAAALQQRAVGHDQPDLDRRTAGHASADEALNEQVGHHLTSRSGIAAIRRCASRARAA